MVPRRARALLIALAWLWLVLLAAQAPPAGAQSTTALIGGTVLRPAQGDSLADATVVIEGGRIAAVGPSDEVDVPAGARRIEARGRYVMPGLIDGHVHFFQSGGLYTRPDVIDLRGRRSYEEEIRRIKESLEETFRRYLASGITSVVDVGGPLWNLQVRQKARELAAAPRVVTAGPLLSTWQPPALDVEDPPILEVHAPERARRLVEKQAAAGVDLIKIWYIVRQGETPAQHRPMVDAAMGAAHDAGLPVAVHATQLETARTAVKAGADILVHSVFDAPVDEAFVQLLVENDVIYTPTIMVRERYGEVLSQQIDLTDAEQRLADPDVLQTLDDLREMPPDRLPPGVRRRMEAPSPVRPSSTAMQNLKALHAAGVTIAAGTDAGNIGTLHGPSLFYELRLMQRAGLTPMEVLQTATRGGARLVRRAGAAGPSALGRLQPGAPADLVVVRQNPLADLMNAAAVEYVIRGGQVFEPKDLVGG